MIIEIEYVPLPVPDGLLWIEKHAPYFLGWQETWTQSEFITALAKARMERPSEKASAYEVGRARRTGFAV